MNGICLIWSRGRLISPSLPVGDDKYLNLSSQKRLTGRNLGRNHLVRRSGTTSRRTVVLVFCLRMRLFPFNSSSYHIRGNEMNCQSQIPFVYTGLFTSQFLYILKTVPGFLPNGISIVSRCCVHLPFPYALCEEPRFPRFRAILKSFCTVRASAYGHEIHDTYALNKQSKHAKNAKQGKA